MKNKVVIIAASGNARDIIEDLLLNGVMISGYIDKTPVKDFKDIKYLGDDDNYDIKINENILITLGSSGDLSLRNKIFSKYKNDSINFIHSKSFLSKNAIVPANSNIIIMMNTVVKAYVNLGKNTFINSNCSIGHHTKIGENSVISIGCMIGGNSNIGKNCFIGMGSLIFENIKIKDNTIIRAGQIVNKSIL